MPSPAPVLAGAVVAGKVALSWSPAPANALGFKIERAMSLQTGVWSPFATLPASSTRFIDTSVGLATTYRYRIRAYNAAGSSPYSPRVTVEVP